jgi:hypothetical protein
MQTETLAPQELFTLNVVAPHLKRFRPPQGAHDPQGDWKLAYGVYTLGAIRGHGGRIGALTVERRAGDDGRALLGIDYRKRVRPQFLNRVTAEVTCRGDTLATPERWTFSSEVARGPGGGQGLVEATRIEQSASASDGAVELRSGDRLRRLEVEPPLAINWGLFEAVGRLPREPFDPIRFTMLDHFDQVKPHQALSYRRSADVLLAGAAVRLHAYDHLGQGIVPWIYWVDDAGRLLFAVSGLEAYLFDSFGPP